MISLRTVVPVTLHLRKNPWNCVRGILRRLHSHRLRKPIMNWFASILTTTTSDTEPTIILNFHVAKYIFNAGENTSRAFTQSNYNWRRTRGIFVSQANARRAGGVPGLCFGFADSAVNQVSIVGPPGLTHYLASMRLFTYRDVMDILTTESSLKPISIATPDPLYRDENITVYTIPITPSEGNATSPTSSSFDERIAEVTPEAVSKRKREPSPDQPQKRRAGNAMDRDHSIHSTSLENAMKSPYFTPGELRGEVAQEWRRLIIKSMFPGTKTRTIVNTNNQKRSKKGKAVQSRAPEPSTESVSKSTAEVDQADEYGRTRKVLPPGFRQQLPKFSVDASEHHKSAPHSLGYIVVGPRVRGKFDAVRAEQLGVLGSLRSRLTRGETVTFKVKVGDQTIERTVRPEECVAQSKSPGVILILDVPTPAHIPSLISGFQDSPFYRKFRSSRPEDIAEYPVHSVFHLCGEGVLSDPSYAIFMSGFGPLVQHIVSSRDHTPDRITFANAGYYHLRLNQLDPAVFPIPNHSLSPRSKISEIPNLPSNVHLMLPSMNITIHPSGLLSEESHPDTDHFHTAAASPESIVLPAETLKHFSQARSRILEEEIPASNGSDVCIIPLGTGSAVPNKYRNVSATLIQIPNWGNILLDAAEGTWGQLCRHFGTDLSSSSNVWQVLRDLKCIFVSHVHADHHLGLAGLLHQRRKLNPPPSEPLYLVSIRPIHLYIHEVSDLQDLGLNDPSGNGVIPIMSDALHYQSRLKWNIGGNEPWTDIDLSFKHGEDMCRSLGLQSFSTVDVKHKTKAFGAVIKHSDGWSVVFSGDTEPCDNLVRAGQGASVLIHEATMADDQTVLARQRAHSTFGEAIEVGRRMGAENVLLTHFSARYPKMPPSLITQPIRVPDATRKEPNIVLGFDLVNLHIGNMWKMKHYFEAMEQSFKDTVVEVGDEEEEAVPVHTMEVGVV